MADDKKDEGLFSGKEMAWAGIEAGASLIKNAKKRKIQKAELKAERRGLLRQQASTLEDQKTERDQEASNISESGVAGGPAAAERVKRMGRKHSDENYAISAALHKVKRAKKAGKLDITSIL